MPTISCLSLLMICLLSSTSSELFGDPPLCLLNRFDLFPCSIQNPRRTGVPGENEYAIYSTRIRVGPAGISSLNCIIRSRDDIVRNLDTIGGDPRMYYLFSPGRALASPESYGNQQLVQYRVQCEENHFAYFDLMSLELQDATCMDINSPGQPRCVDYLQLSRGGSGFSEACGSTIPPELKEQLDTDGTIELILRTSESERFPGFIATVVCVDSSPIGTSMGGVTGGSSLRVHFAARVRRHVEYIHRMRRSASASLEKAKSLACSVEEINVPFNARVTYTDRVVRIIDVATMAMIRRLPSPINKLVIMDTSGALLKFTREAPPSSNSVLSGPGVLTRAGECVYYMPAVTMGGISPEAVIPSGQEAIVTRRLLSAHTRLPLEQDRERLSIEKLEPPPFNLSVLGQVDEGPRVGNIVENLEPVQCNFTDDILSLVILNQESMNPVLSTVISVIIDCTEREQPGRIQELMESIVVQPVIVTQLENQKVLTGSTAIFRAMALGGSLLYQWFFNGDPLSDSPGMISGANKDTLSVFDVQQSDVGEYQVEVANLAGSVNYNAVSLSLIVAPFIDLQPENVQVPPGDTTVFCAIASGGGLLYQWFFNGNPLSNRPGVIRGANKNILVVLSVQPSNIGEYQVRASNLAGSVDSNAVSLSLIVAPVIDLQPENVQVPPGDMAVFCAMASGGGLLYQWFFNGDPLSDHSGVISGANKNILVVLSVQPNHVGEYQVRASNLAGSVNSNAVSLSLTVVPIISTHPESLVILPGDTAVFRGGASGAGLLFYQWFFNGDPLIGTSGKISGANEDVLSIFDVQSSDVGHYKLRVTNFAGFADSGAAFLLLGDP